MKLPRRLLSLLTLCLVALVSLGAGGRRGPAFVDQDGDGFNDLAPDTDRDGIPDCVDPDQTRLRVGTPRRGPGGQGTPWRAGAVRPDSLARDSLLYRGWYDSRARQGWGPAWQWQHAGQGGAGWQDPLAPCPQGGRFLNDPNGRNGSGGGNGGGNGGGHGPGGH
ncbi:MAG: hypothetical protein WC326_00305 [Candidatus Delongbacteria bacterium]